MIELSLSAAPLDVQTALALVRSDAAGGTVVFDHLLNFEKSHKDHEHGEEPASEVAGRHQVRQKIDFRFVRIAFPRHGGIVFHG